MKFRQEEIVTKFVNELNSESKKYAGFNELFVEVRDDSLYIENHTDSIRLDKTYIYNYHRDSGFNFNKPVFTVVVSHKESNALYGVHQTIVTDNLKDALSWIDEIFWSEVNDTYLRIDDGEEGNYGEISQIETISDENPMDPTELIDTFTFVSL